MIKTVVIYGSRPEMGLYGLAHGMNALAAEGSSVVRAGALFQVPQDRPNTDLYHSKKCWKENGEKIRALSGKETEILEAETVRCPAAELPSVIVTCEGTELPVKKEFVRPVGYDLLVMGYAGLEGMLRIAEEQEETVAKRYPASFLHLIYGHTEEIFGLKKAAAARAANIPILHHVGQGGIFKALWDFAAETGCGLDADLRKIPILQETIEVCELFGMNPYQLTSAGCFLLAVRDGNEALRKIRQQGEEACLIGKLTGGNDKVLRNEGEIRYVDRPSQDELWKLWKIQ